MPTIYAYQVPALTNPAERHTAKGYKITLSVGPYRQQLIAQLHPVTGKPDCVAHWQSGMLAIPANKILAKKANRMHGRVDFKDVAQSVMDDIVARVGVDRVMRVFKDAETINEKLTKVPHGGTPDVRFQDGTLGDLKSC